MPINTHALKNANPDNKLVHEPVFFRVANQTEQQQLNDLLASGEVLFVHDEITGQLQELIKSLNPSVRIKADEYPALISSHLKGVDIDDYGVWVYYPWSHRLVHLLDEDEFVEVRTNRNQLKITRDERKLLQTKKIGIVGLSVGQSIALTIAMERICGELRLADFDTAELSNLNRLRTGLHNMGINKTIIAAREIAEIDPFIKIKLFHDGLTKTNIDEFFTGTGKLDLFIEVCDGMDIKIESRFKARELQIPVVMDTNDRGMLDVERFDLEPNRPILHGLADGLDPDNIKGLTNEQKIPYVLKMVGADTISTRMKASMMEVETSINTWPQLASSVVLGGALTTDVCRRILLDQYHASGRYYIDLEELVKDENPVGEKKSALPQNPFTPLSPTEQSGLIALYFKNSVSGAFSIDDQQLNKIIDAAIAAPSAGNNQPWKWVYSNGVLFLFHDRFRSWSWGDYYEMGAIMGLGTAIENVSLQAAALQLNIQTELYPLANNLQLVAAIRFSKPGNDVDANIKLLADNIFTRTTNRKLGGRQKLNAGFLNEFQKVIGEFKPVQVFYTEDDNQLNELGDIIAECDKVRLLNEQGHDEFFHEVRWNKQQAIETKDGVEVEAVDLTAGDIAGFKVAQDWNAIELLAKWGKGDAFKKMSVKSVASASAIVVFTIPDFNREMLITAGRAVEKAWIFANINGVSIHPMLSPAFFFNMVNHGGGKGMEQNVIDNLLKLRQRFLNIFHLEDNKEVFVMKLSMAAPMGTKSLRKDKSELFFKQ